MAQGDHRGELAIAANPAIGHVAEFAIRRLGAIGQQQPGRFLRQGLLRGEVHQKQLGRIFLAYCRCRRKGTDDTMNIVAGITDGDADDLMVGRNGVFYDRKGDDWDATITKLVEHPISVRQAFCLAPGGVCLVLGVKPVGEVFQALDSEPVFY